MYSPQRGLAREDGGALWRELHIRRQSYDIIIVYDERKLQIYCMASPCPGSPPLN